MMRVNESASPKLILEVGYDKESKLELDNNIGLGNDGGPAGPEFRQCAGVDGQIQAAL